MCKCNPEIKSPYCRKCVPTVDVTLPPMIYRKVSAPVADESANYVQSVPKPADRPNVVTLPYLEPHIPEYPFEDGLVPGSEICIGETVIGHVPDDSVSGRNEPCSDPIVEANVNMLRNRSRVGVEKYGLTLADNRLKLRDWLQHALEETLDKANYLQRAIKAIDDGDI